jgi:hypothetical protein
MLNHLPFSGLPVIIDYADESREPTAEDEEGIFLSLQCRNRICRIRLLMHVKKLRRLVVAMDGEFPALQYLNIKPVTTDDDNKGVILPETFKAPHLPGFALDVVSYFPDLFHSHPSTPRVQSTQRNDLRTRGDSSQQWRYVLPLFSALSSRE